MFVVDNMHTLESESRRITAANNLQAPGARGRRGRKDGSGSSSGGSTSDYSSGSESVSGWGGRET